MMQIGEGRTGLRVHDLKASYGTRKKRLQVLDGATFEAARGEITVVVGSSGAGKSTLINCVAGLQPIEDGEIQFLVDGGASVITCNRRRSLSAYERRSIGVCFQQSHLWSHMSVRDNLIHPQVWLKGIAKTIAQNRADELLESLRLGPQAQSPVSQLSGGQRQRVAILRALAVKPEILLLDEITASQDPANVQSIFDIVKKYVAETGCTVLTISHDMQFVRKIANMVHLLHHGAVVDSCSSADLAAGRIGRQLTEFTRAFDLKSDPQPPTEGATDVFILKSLAYSNQR
jgi:polar amino acid transport system ATP-binding protein